MPETHLNVLYVEDSKVQQLLVTQALRDVPWINLEIVDTLTKGLAQAAACDVVLLDLHLPDTDGPLDGLKSMKAAYPEIPIVVLSGDVTQAKAAMVLGADDFVPKGMDPGQMLARSLQNARTRRHRENRLATSLDRYDELLADNRSYEERAVLLAELKRQSTERGP